MLDDLRNSAKDPYSEVETSSPRRRPVKKKQFLGMSAAQRFVVAFFLMVIVLVLGTFCLLATGRIVLP